MVKRFELQNSRLPSNLIVHYRRQTTDGDTAYCDVLALKRKNEMCAKAKPTNERHNSRVRGDGFYRRYYILSTSSPKNIRFIWDEGRLTAQYPRNTHATNYSDNMGS
ncbi:hypothetical protein CBL_03999 [Carabus blaptoides fortunei]